MQLEITQEGMNYWDTNMPKTEFGEEIGVKSGASDKERGIFVLGLMYGAAPEDPEPLVRLNPPVWRRILANLVEAGYLRIVEE